MNELARINTIQNNAESRRLSEDLSRYAAALKRGWRLVVASTALCLTAALLYADRSRVTYQATARLVVIQQGGHAFTGPAGDAARGLAGGDDLIPTNLLLIRSSAIVERAITRSGLSGLSTDSVIDRLSVTLPDSSSKVLLVTYRSDRKHDARQLVQGVIEAYREFLKEHYQRTSGDTVRLLTQAREGLAADLRRMEQEYLEYRQNNPSYSSDEKGRTFAARRLDQWDQAANQVAARSLQLQAQIELGRKLIGEGVEPATVARAVGRLEELVSESAAAAAAAQAEKPSPGGRSFEQLEAELEDIKFERLTASLLVDHLESDLAAGGGRPKVDETEVAREFEQDPETAFLRAELAKAKTKYNEAKRLARKDHDPAVVASLQRVRGLEAELVQLWRRQRPHIMAKLQRNDADGALAKAESDLRVLAAREAALTESLGQVKAARLQKVRRERQQLAGQVGPEDSRVLRLDEQIDRLAGGAAATGATGGPKTPAFLSSIEQSLEALESLKARIQQRFASDVAESKKAEIDQLREANLRSAVERQKVLFHSVVDQLKQAQLASDYGSVSAEVISPPAEREVHPPRALIVVVGLLAGVGLGAGLAFLSASVDARFFTLSEIRDALNLNVLGVIPRLTRKELGGDRVVGLVCHEASRCPFSECFRTVRTHVERICRDYETVVLQVTSPQPGDGKSTTASNLAISFAQAGRRVLLVDADLRRPVQHTTYGLGRERGLPFLIQGALTVGYVAQRTQVDNLDLVAAGPQVSNPAELLASPHLLAVVEDFRGEYDVIVLDSPPVLAVADPMIVSAVTDGVILVVGAETARRQDVERTVNVLRALSTPLLGAVINDVPRVMFSRAFGRAGETYYYGPPVGVVTVTGAAEKGGPPLPPAVVDGATAYRASLPGPGSGRSPGNDGGRQGPPGEQPRPRRTKSLARPRRPEGARVTRAARTESGRGPTRPAEAGGGTRPGGGSV
jgi:capsular exopolysaccharide synthesis family protein